jgi:hypothetical protein
MGSTWGQPGIKLGSSNLDRPTKRGSPSALKPSFEPVHTQSASSSTTVDVSCPSVVVLPAPPAPDLQRTPGSSETATQTATHARDSWVVVCIFRVSPRGPRGPVPTRLLSIAAAAVGSASRVAASLASYIWTLGADLSVSVLPPPAAVPAVPAAANCGHPDSKCLLLLAPSLGRSTHVCRKKRAKYVRLCHGLLLDVLGLRPTPETLRSTLCNGNARRGHRGSTWRGRPGLQGS